MLSEISFVGHVTRGERGGVIPYEGLTGACGPIGYGFQDFFVLKGVSILLYFVLYLTNLI